ncbi:hypothetical protein AJ80_03396 [Polytolypa hystricis UAMH7299]|uniref:Uncharacterized protein n=1 Tax=Polytolypa hystricis (strain UAMH7299) TaxID=1447883 RepID=A0A2B7YJ73_POLH7|nr:hypothetical protein AJ80_03396 [Polytolypa hystricis UAMH7299]
MESHFPLPSTFTRPLNISNETANSVADVLVESTREYKLKNIDTQHQSLFFSRFPGEIQEAIYLELWRSVRLSQHIFWHEDKENSKSSKYCLWPCTTEFHVEN